MTVQASSFAHARLGPQNRLLSYVAGLSLGVSEQAQVPVASVNAFFCKVAWSSCCSRNSSLETFMKY